jgi:hypothetical protein
VKSLRVCAVVPKENQVPSTPASEPSCVSAPSSETRRARSPSRKVGLSVATISELRSLSAPAGAPAGPLPARRLVRSSSNASLVAAGKRVRLSVITMMPVGSPGTLGTYVTWWVRGTYVSTLSKSSLSSHSAVPLASPPKFREKPGWLWLRLHDGGSCHEWISGWVATIVVAVAGVVVLAALPSRAQQKPLSEGRLTLKRRDFRMATNRSENGDWTFRCLRCTTRLPAQPCPVVDRSTTGSDSN